MKQKYTKSNNNNIINETNNVYLHVTTLQAAWINNHNNIIMHTAPTITTILKHSHTLDHTPNVITNTRYLHYEFESWKHIIMNIIIMCIHINTHTHTQSKQGKFSMGCMGDESCAATSWQCSCQTWAS